MQNKLIEQSKLSYVKTIEINTDRLQWDEYAGYIMESLCSNNALIAGEHNE